LIKSPKKLHLSVIGSQKKSLPEEHPSTGRANIPGSPVKTFTKTAKAPSSVEG
jgi:hypothetical protein